MLGMSRSSRALDWLGVATFLVVTLGLYLAFNYAPTEARMGSIQRIFYFHMGSNVAALGAIVVAALAGALFLRTGAWKWDRLAAASMELGFLFGAISLATGMIWARPVWGTWWTWDPRLTTFLVLWLFYIAYLMLRASARDDPGVARLAAVFTFVGVTDVPFVIIAPRIWRGISPVLVGNARAEDLSQSFGMTSEMLLTLIVSIVGIVLLFVYLLAQRVRLEELRAEVDALHAESYSA